MIARLGVLTSGGDCAGLNAAIRAVVLHAAEAHGAEVWGIRNGTEGLMRRPVAAGRLRPEAFDGTYLRRGGTVLGSISAGDPFAWPMPDGTVRDRTADIAAILAPVAVPLEPGPLTVKPFVVLMVGVNGSGKTTTIGKLARQWTAAGKSVVLAAGDTFRAAAIEQLQIWGERTGAEVVAGTVGADPAALAYDALARARAIDADVLLVDTAGRLQNKKNLMDELQKVVRVMRKLEPKAPHDVLLVLDATTGQNALNQVEVFADVCDVSGLAMTKLDGTARGGVLVAVARRHGMPIHFVGIGETAEDLQPFDAHAFARALAGLDGER